MNIICPFRISISGYGTSRFVIRGVCFLSLICCSWYFKFLVNASFSSLTIMSVAWYIQ